MNVMYCPIYGIMFLRVLYIGTCVCVVGVVLAHVIYCCYGNVKAGGCMLVVWGVRWTGRGTGRQCPMHSENSSVKRKR